MPDQHLSRRNFLGAGIATVLCSSAGCIESRSPYAPPVVDDRPDAVYVPSHFEEMAQIGQARSGPLSAELRYSYPHRFWLVSGSSRNRVSIQPEDAIHLMATIWDRRSGRVVFGLGPKTVVRKDGTIVDERFLWPMLSQPMGFHYGDNLPLDGGGTYTISMAAPPTSLDAGPGIGERLDRPATFEFEFAWNRSDLENLTVHSIGEGRRGTRDALSPMAGGSTPISTTPNTLPGTSLGTTESDEIAIRGSLLDDGTSPPLLVILAQTPYNGYPIPNLGMRATVDGSTDSSSVRQTISAPEGFHYRVQHPALATGKSVRIEFTTQPQIARHEGYETAFTDPTSVEFSLP